jgi:hypothetical protein
VEGCGRMPTALDRIFAALYDPAFAVGERLGMA